MDTCNDDLACITMASHDRLGLEAIKSLHSQLDDDANGNVDLSARARARACVYLYIHSARVCACMYILYIRKSCFGKYIFGKYISYLHLIINSF